MTESPLAADRRHILDKTADLWEPLRGERVFIAGGTGFVGTWLMEAFIAANKAHNLGAQAVLLTRDPERFRRRAPHLAGDDAVSYIVGKASTFEAPIGTFAFVIHAATERWFEADRARPLGILGEDFTLTCRVLDLAASCGARRFLFTSSGAVYGASATALDRIPEEYPGAPATCEARSAYGESKRLSEIACMSYGRVFGFNALIARLFAFVGPHLPLDEGYAVGNFLADVLAKRPISIGGDGTPRRSYLYAADLAIWLWTIFLRGQTARPYNVGSASAVSIRGLADVVVESIAPGRPVTVARPPREGATPPSYVPEIVRAERELGLRAWIQLPQALRRTYDFLLDQQRASSTQ